MTERSYEAKLAALFVASERLLEHMGTGYEPCGQEMRATMAQQAVREFRKACTALGLGAHRFFAAPPLHAEEDDCG